MRRQPSSQHGGSQCGGRESSVTLNIEDLPMPRFMSATIITVLFSFRIVIAPAYADYTADICEPVAAETR